MKKVFVEPEMQIIELNLQENIATSTQTSMGYIFMVDFFGCTIKDTNYKIGQVFGENDIISCAVNLGIRTMMNIYPREQVLPYLKR